MVNIDSYGGYCNFNDGGKQRYIFKSIGFKEVRLFCRNFLSCFLPDIKQPYSTLFYLVLNFGMAVIVQEIFERNISCFLKNIFNFNRRSA